MKTTLSAEQTSFYSKNGYIEFEINHPPAPEKLERDQWRQDAKLKDFLIRKLGPIALALTGKKQIRLALDQVISKENRPKKASTLKEMFSIQGFILGAVISNEPVTPPKRSSLGILPLPTNADRVLFFKTDIILDWPHLGSDIYLVLFALPNAVYVHNPNDPSTNFLKQLGYNFGDLLKNETHPQIL